jgi:3-oxoacyl-[acyl-carrier protein] reductase
MIANRWGRIINITSRSGRTAVPFASAGYSASKAGLAGLTRLLASEVGEHGITVNAIAPGGLIRTPMSTKLDAAAMEKLTAGSYVRRPGTEYEGTAEDIAAGVVFLASEAAGFITGTELDINGGMFMA